MGDTTFTIPAGSSLDNELERVAGDTGHSKEEVAPEALASWLEDQSDAMTVREIASRNEPTTSLAEMRREFDLER